MLVPCFSPNERTEIEVVAGRAIHRLDQFWATGNIALQTTSQRVEAR
jgi:hypothetical protein